MKKILIIAYYFPPIQSGGVYRPLKFVKYLREFGWEPVVLTINPVTIHSIDAGLLNDVPENILVERTPQLDFYRLIGLFRKNRPTEQVGGGENNQDKPASRGKGKSGSSLMRMLSGFKRQLLLFVRGVFFVPDDEVPWLPVAFARAIKIAKREGVDAVMTTSPPQSAHMVGLLVKWATGLPWVVDFRDLWMDEFDLYERPYGRWRRPVEKLMEKMVVKRADRVINISQGEKLCLQSSYNDLPAEKFHVIDNGFDPEDFEVSGGMNGADREKRDRLRITYIGTLYVGTADEFFDVMSGLFVEDPGIGDRLEIRFVGPIDAEYLERLENSNFSHSIHMTGMVSHDEAIREMCEGDVLLVLMGGEKMQAGEVPGKIYEYMGARKPILSLVRQGDVSAILKETDMALIVDPRNASEIRKTLLSLLDSWEHNTLPQVPNDEHINIYSRKELTGKLSVLLNEMVS